jgi:four helix bundle protein
VAEKRVQSFRDLDAWQLGLSLAVAIHGVVKHLPQSEQFGLSSQMRRAASQGRPTMRKDKRAAKTAVASIIFEWQLGSLGELSTQVEIAAQLAMLASALASETEEHVGRTGQVLHGLLRYRLQRRRRKLAGSALLCCTLWFSAFAVLG